MLIYALISLYIIGYFFNVAWFIYNDANTYFDVLIIIGVMLLWPLMVFAILGYLSNKRVFWKK